MGDFFLLSGAKESLGVLASAISQVASVQNSQYAIVARSGLACPGSLQDHGERTEMKKGRGTQSSYREQSWIYLEMRSPTQVHRLS